MTSPYKIDGDKLITFVSQDPYSLTFHKLGDTYYAARNNEFGYANYEIIPAPQIAVNPVTEIINQVSTELGLTQEQKEKIIPILNNEIKQLTALKENTTLSGPQEDSRNCGRLASPSTRRSGHCSMRSNSRSSRKCAKRCGGGCREDGGRGRCQVGRYG